MVLAGLGHAGGQGSSAYSQSVLWAPSAVADVASRETAHGHGATRDRGPRSRGSPPRRRLAVDAGLDGVELDAGPLSVLRQFHSGLTNQRDDDFGQDRLLLTREVVAAVRRAVGPDRIVALRLSCDELAPWAGVTPEHAADQVAALADSLDLLTVVRGGPYSSTAYRPDAHTPDGFNLGLCAAMRRAADGRVPVVLQGSVVDPAMAAVGAGRRHRRPGGDDPGPDRRPRPRGQGPRRRGVDGAALHPVQPGVPGARQPQSAGELRGRAPVRARDRRRRPGAPGPDGPDPDVDALVVGAGPAGLECARVLALRGHRVRVVERSDHLGGALRDGGRRPRTPATGRTAGWLGSECERLGVRVATGTEVDGRRPRCRP